MNKVQVSGSINSFIGTQSYLVVHILSVVAYVLELAELSSDRDHVAVSLLCTNLRSSTVISVSSYHEYHCTVTFLFIVCAYSSCQTRKQEKVEKNRLGTVTLLNHSGV